MTVGLKIILHPERWCFADRNAAEVRLTELTRVQHKQVFWITERANEG